MKYHNKATGAVIEVSSAISGGDWEEYEELESGRKRTGKKKEEPAGDNDEEESGDWWKTMRVSRM